ARPRGWARGGSRCACTSSSARRCGGGLALAKPMRARAVSRRPMTSVAPSSSLATARSPAARGRRDVALWLFGCAAMIFLMVVIGGITRLTESGLSITEWQPVSGVIPPSSDADWAREFEHYKAIPQYQAIHAGMTLAEFKTIFFW